MFHGRQKGPFGDQLKLRVEARGTAQGNLPKQFVLERPLEPGGWFSHWSGLSLSGDDYKQFGEITAWRVSCGNTRKIRWRKVPEETTARPRRA